MIVKSAKAILENRKRRKEAYAGGDNNLAKKYSNQVYKSMQFGHYYIPEEFLENYTTHYKRNADVQSNLLEQQER